MDGAMTQRHIDWDAATIGSEAAKRGLSKIQAALLRWLFRHGEYTADWGQLDGDRHWICLTKVTTSKYALAGALRCSPSGVYKALMALEHRGIIATESRPTGTLIMVCWNRLRELDPWGDRARESATRKRDPDEVVGRSRRQSAAPPSTTVDLPTQDKAPAVDLDSFPGFPDGIFQPSLPDVRLYTVLRKWWHEWHLGEEYDANQITGAILATRHRDRDAPEQYCRAVLRNGVTTRWCKAAEKWRERQSNELARTNGHRMTGRGGQVSDAGGA